jgi:t-SNARE complex subunit (syntaxin)
VKKIDENIKEIRCSNFEKQAIYNTSELVKNRLRNLSEKFHKFLQGQAEIIRKVEERRTGLAGRQNNNLRAQNNFYNPLPNNDEEESIEVNMSISTQATMQRNNNSKYYEERTQAVQGIEKIMNDLSQMFTKMSQMVYEQRSMIERIDNNTDISLNNIEAGLQEVIKIQKDVRGNRKLILKVNLL